MKTSRHKPYTIPVLLALAVGSAAAFPPAGLAQPAPASARPLLTGEVYSRQAQDIVVPLTTNMQASISAMAEEGSHVAPGDTVVAFDGSEAYSQLEQQREAWLAEQAATDRDLARLEKERMQAEFGVRQAELELELAAMKAEIPEGLIGALEYAENQLAKETADTALTDARALLEDKNRSLAERQRRAALDEEKAELTENWWEELLASLTVQARQDGFVIHQNHPWTGAKFQEGDNVRTSYRIAQVADTSDLEIRVWVNSVDRPHLEAGQTVRIVLDALPQLSLSGRLESLSDSGAKRPEWGEAVYFDGTVSFDADQVSGLLPGMSVLVEVL